MIESLMTRWTPLWFWEDDPRPTYMILSPPVLKEIKIDALKYKKEIDEIVRSVQAQLEGRQ